MSATVNLSDYLPEINAVATTNKLEPEDAVDKFVVNLTTMSGYYPGAESLNFRELGQQWNKLLSKQKVAQKAEVKKMIRKGTRTTRGRTLSED